MASAVGPFVPDGENEPQSVALAIEKLLAYVLYASATAVMETRSISETAFTMLIREVVFYEAPAQEGESGKETQEVEMARTQRIEMMGYEIGYRFMERMSMDQKFLGFTELDLIKFICKDFWDEIFKKKIDKLQTNHKGVFVLFDNSFRWLEKHASDDQKTRDAATTLLHFPCGILRGALANLGMPVIVNADFSRLPAITFNIKAHKG